MKLPDVIRLARKNEIILLQSSSIENKDLDMKHFLIYTLLLILGPGLMAQDNSSYMMVMVKQKKAFRMAQTVQDFQNLAETFERIANAETDQWHPLYYAGLCYINMSLVLDNPEMKDSYLDKAQGFIDRALLIYPDESELYVIQALSYQARIQVNPDERTAAYSRKAEEALTVARDYNAENPRIYYLLALNQLYASDDMAEAISPACENFQTAVNKFRNFRPEHVLSPTWGGERNQELYSRFCTDQE
jgi:hypothetical protein